MIRWFFFFFFSISPKSCQNPIYSVTAACVSVSCRVIRGSESMYTYIILLLLCLILLYISYLVRIHNIILLVAYYRSYIPGSSVPDNFTRVIVYLYTHTHTNNDSGGEMSAQCNIITRIIINTWK